MRPLLFVLSTLLGVTQDADPAASSSTRAQAYVHFLLAKNALGRDDYSGALDEFAQARDLDPTSPTVRMELSEVYLRLRRYKDALREAQKAVELDPFSEPAMELLAQLFEQTGDTERALEMLQRLSDLRPGQAMYLVRMAALQDRAGRSEDAVRLLEAAVSRDPSATEAVFELVEHFRGIGRIDRAIETLERAATAEPDNLYVRSKLAELFLQVRDPRRARQALEAMVTAAPGNLQVLLEVARAMRQLEDDARAAELYRRALAIGSDQDAIRVNLASALARSGQLREALSEFRKALEETGSPAQDPARNPERAEYLKRIGLLQLELGEPKAAIESFEQARGLGATEDVDVVRALCHAYDLAGEPRRGLAILEEKNRGRDKGDRAQADLLIGEAAFRILAGRPAEGLKAYREIEAAQPLEVRHHAFVAYALLRTREPAADEVLKAAVKAEPAEERRTFRYIAGLLFEGNDNQAAFALIDRLITRYPDDRDLYLYTAGQHTRLKQDAEAVQLLERAARLHPEDADVRFRLGAAYERQKRIEDALRELDASIQREPRHAMALNYTAYLLAERGEQLDKALHYIERALAIDPENGAFLDTLGWAQFKLGEHQKARQSLERALERVEDATVRAHLGDVLLKLGDPEGALKEYERARSMPGAEEVEDLKRRMEQARKAAAAPAK